MYNVYNARICAYSTGTRKFCLGHTFLPPKVSRDTFSLIPVANTEVIPVDIGFMYILVTRDISTYLVVLIINAFESNEIFLTDKK